MLIAIMVVGILVGLLVPALGGVREHARRVVCASNQRQVGLGLHMFADQHDDRIPGSIFLDSPDPTDEDRPQDMITVRVEMATRAAASASGSWDGLGHLYADGYLPAAKVFYCPSHAGSIRFESYADQWEGRPGEIVTNYHYRGMGPDGSRRLALIPSTAALVSDSIRTYDEINHAEGFNILQAGLSVNWVQDSEDLITALLLRAGDEGDAHTSEFVWTTLDGQANSAAPGGS